MRKLQIVPSLIVLVAMICSLPVLAAENAPAVVDGAAVTAATTVTAEVTPPPAPAPAPPPAPTAAPAPPPAATPIPEPPKAAPAGPLQIKIGDATVKFGLLVQPQADFTQNPAGAYAQNLMIRRTRFLVGGQVAKTMFFFFETENSRLGAATAAGAKTMTTGFQTLDAAVEWRPKKSFNLSGGLIRVPTSRDALESASNEFTLDFNSYAFTATAGLGGTAGRDTGVQARGYFLNDRLEYRAAVISGMRENGNTNEFRTVGRIQYNFFDTEVYNFPSYAGSNFGAKKILAVGAAYDRQMYYDGMTVDVFADIPTSFGSALGTVTFQQLDGGTTAPTALAKSNIASIDGGVFIKKLKMGTWARYEQRNFDTVNNRDEKRIVAGVNYYPMANNFNIKAGIGRVKPAVGDSMTQFTLQIQVFYF
jgi:hypothetical protein